MTSTHLADFSHFLRCLEKTLAKVEAHDGAGEVLSQRLADDMFPLVTQAETAMGFSLRASCPIAQRPVVSFVEEKKSYAGLKRQLRCTLDHLQLLNAMPQDMTVTIRDMAGPTAVAARFDR